MKIITAEDDPISRHLLTKTLKVLGHEVVATEDGNEAWVAYRAHNVQMVISDWMMPGLNGLELCRLIRNEQRSKYTYIILLTAMEGKGKYLEGMEAGADDFITKPFDKDTLTARLRVAERILNLQAEVKQLEGLLPICAYCKKIQDDNHEWTQMERYISKRTEANFSHGICPECYKNFMLPQLEKLRGARKTQPG